MPPLDNGKTKTYPWGSDRGKVHGQCCLTPRSAPIWFPRVQRKWSFRATGKHVQGRKRGEYKSPVQVDETIQLLLSRLVERIRGRGEMLLKLLCACKKLWRGDSKELKFQEGSEATGEEGGRQVPLGFQTHRCPSAGIAFFLKTQVLNPEFPLLLQCTIQFSPYHWWNGERPRKSGGHVVGVEAQIAAIISRATDKDQGQSSPTPGKGSVLPAVFSLPSKSLFPSPGRCHWTSAQGL